MSGDFGAFAAWLWPLLAFFHAEPLSPSCPNPPGYPPD